MTSLDHVPLEEARSYDAYELQSEFSSHSPREAYGELCRRAGCHPSKVVTALLPDTPDAWDAVEWIDLSRTYVGPKGVVPVMELCKRLPCLRRLNLAGNYLQNDSVWFLAQLAAYHPCLAEIDISNNEFVSWSGAMSLAAAVVQNVRITFVNVLRTAVEPMAAEVLFYHTRKNAVAMAVARGLTMHHPTNHPIAIHLRAMRHFFEEVQDPVTRCVTREDIVRGYAEHLHALGRDGELASRKQGFFDDLRRRAPSDNVTWEVFVVLILVDAVEYAEDFTSALRRVFTEFNINANIASEPVCDTPPPVEEEHPASAHPVFTDGFVEVAAFPAIHVRLFGQVIADKDAEALCKSAGLEHHSGTVNWDEFLYIWYNKGPAEGTSFIRTNLTQLPRRIQLVHS